MKILLLGAGGQLGQAVLELARLPTFPIGWSVVGWNREAGDLSRPDDLISKIKLFKPDAIMNAAAYTQVDRAETEKDLSMIVNSVSPGVIAQYSAKNNIPLVHFSSDYVYAGDGLMPHLESEPSAPQNHYGKTKADGDALIQKSGADFLIFRTSWVYSHTGKNFVKTMQKLGTEKSELKIVGDQFGSPTYAVDLAQASLDALMLSLERKVNGLAFPSGIYHFCNAGITNWADFAKAILPEVKIIGIKTSEYPTPAKRPLNSRLSIEKLKTTFGIEPRAWQVALADCLNRLETTHG